MAAVIEALAQWDALSQREIAEDYQIKEVSTAASAAATSGLRLPMTPNSTTCCPSAWREKIVEWCYQVVDHW
jgi:hypothetical protein